MKKTFLFWFFLGIAAFALGYLVEAFGWKYVSIAAGVYIFNGLTFKWICKGINKLL